MFNVNPIAEAISGVSKIVYEMVHKDQRELIDDSYKEACRDVEQFKQALLKGDSDTVDLMLNGLMCAIPANLTPSENGRLNDTKVPNFTASDMLGFYCRARSADHSARVTSIVQTTNKG